MKKFGEGMFKDIADLGIIGFTMTLFVIMVIPVVPVVLVFYPIGLLTCKLMGIEDEADEEARRG